MNKALEAYGFGNIEVAKKIFDSILKIEPNNSDANHNMGLLLIKSSNLEEALPFLKTALESNFSVAQYWFSYIDTLFKAGSFTQASELLATAKDKGCKGPAFDGLETKLSSKEVALEIRIQRLQKCDDDGPYAYLANFELGNAMQKLGKLEEAIEAYTKALTLKHDYAEAYYNMGIALAAQSKLEEAIDAYTKALSFMPDYAEAYNNMGIALHEQGKQGEAIDAYTKALSFMPDYAEAYYNMGIALHELGKQGEAIEAYTKALTLKHDYAEAYNSMGIALHELGKLHEAIEAYTKALSFKPDYAEVWNTIFYSLSAIKLQVSSEEEFLSLYPEDIGCQKARIEKIILNYKLNQGTASAESSFRAALDILSGAENINIQNPKVNKNRGAIKAVLPKKLIALVHFGRSGTGLLHSLIDGHQEISTMPSHYLSEYFDHFMWEKIILDGWDAMADRFIQNYEVLFDASAENPTLTKSRQLIRSAGRKEGMANVGPQQNEVLKVDKTLFRTELNHLMEHYDQLGALVFFKLVQASYNKAINDLNHKQVLFYHIHNPDKYAELNFVTLAPNAEWIMMVREPIQSCESWIKPVFSKNDYAGCTNQILVMLFEIDNIIYQKQRAVGVRLEDLKKQPQKTIHALCKWMGVNEYDSLYEMTAQGKKWWGDPSSPDFTKDGMEPFGKVSIKRKVGSVFSKTDQLILRTLFYPFSVRFGYVKENEKQFKLDLQKIRPMLNTMFDFEKIIAKRTHVHPEHFIKLGSFLHFRSRLIDRWNILDEHHTYPNMIAPL